MKIFLTITLFLLISNLASSQTIVFNKSAYSTSEPIKVLVNGELLGIESDIKKSSYSATKGSNDLGMVTAPGFYRIDFKFAGDITKSYLIGVLPPMQTTNENYVLELGNSVSNIGGNTVSKMFAYFRDEKDKLLAISEKATKKFGAENAVGLVLNASFCITTISGQPAVMVICKSLSVSNLKKLGLALMSAYLLDMKDKNYITEQEYAVLATVFTYSQINAMLNNNCSLLFKSLKSIIDNPDLKIALGYFEQQCKTTMIILEKVKIP
ncbi:hypothetical protein [Pedobacter sp.]|jgi:hypothetical protein|uniref:hypothetical protein n=1 Tax=Pedobacter sp. TaxID=1411316 RepID=UPI002C050ACE|nr:hypothetical protein [Pedobacter sp.]HWW41503.1 hypothetical protein [Pedobacter sp.]